MNELIEILGRIDSPPGGGVLATLVRVEGSSYRRAGARLLVTPGGARIGSISGGCLEEDLVARALDVQTTGRPELVTYDTRSENDLVWGVGLGCQGVVHVQLERVESTASWIQAVRQNLAVRQPTALAVVWQAAPGVPLGTRLADSDDAAPGVFHQTIAPPTALVIWGAGDDAQPLARLAKELGWHVTLADARPEFGTAVRFPHADAIVVAPPDRLVHQVNPPPDAVSVIMTHRYLHDVPILRELLQRPAAYIGLLGPKRRAERILSELRDAASSTPPGGTSRPLHAPVGLDLGAETPAEVALSILAEIQAVLSGRDARPLRERGKPIHE